MFSGSSLEIPIKPHYLAKNESKIYNFSLKPFTNSISSKTGVVKAILLFKKVFFERAFASNILSLCDSKIIISPYVKRVVFLRGFFIVPPGEHNNQ